MPATLKATAAAVVPEAPRPMLKARRATLKATRARGARNLGMGMVTGIPLARFFDPFTAYSIRGRNS
jgi:hypothetical protein